MLFLRKTDPLPRFVGTICAVMLCISLWLTAILMMTAVATVWYWLPLRCYENVAVQVGIKTHGWKSYGWNCYLTDDRALQSGRCAGNMEPTSCPRTMKTRYTEELNEYYDKQSKNSTLMNPMKVDTSVITSPSVRSLVFNLFAASLSFGTIFAWHVSKCSNNLTGKIGAIVTACLLFFLCLLSMICTFDALHKGISSFKTASEDKTWMYGNRFDLKPVLVEGSSKWMHAVHGTLISFVMIGCLFYAVLMFSIETKTEEKSRKRGVGNGGSGVSAGTSDPSKGDLSTARKLTPSPSKEKAVSFERMSRGSRVDIGNLTRSDPKSQKYLRKVIVKRIEEEWLSSVV